MKFCIISPTSGLRQFATKSHTHLVLPQIHSKEYINFYQERGRAGDFLILDNGAYEGALTHNERLLERIELYKPDVVVCPDAMLHEGSTTVDLTKRFLDEYSGRVSFPGLEYMGVPSATGYNIFDFYEGCKKMLDDPRITWIGLGRFLYTHFGEKPEFRFTIAEIIKNIRPDIKIHALGMAAGSLLELDWLTKKDIISSCDSSAPVWRGWNGRLIDTPQASEYWAQEGSPVDFNAPLPSTDCVNKINYNIERVLQVCKALY
jgi:hypothetical protein